ncbi:hypothetical protein XELAEV_18032462mg [Xenopus laevis]|uniref:Uncharacterized protein n=1 Tax=Xenopus laevis TaxID=8355 RepID=A0A974CQA2_XENLA|nr:hypothetical protein XELAEV_18032462mg [Xenopus laevis]
MAANVLTSDVTCARRAAREFADMAEEKEALQRQIRMLQDLITSHRNIHGNVPAPVAPASTRWRNPAQPPYRAPGVFRGGHTHRGHTHRASRFIAPAQEQPKQGWKNKYSLVNRGVMGSTSTAPAVSSHGNEGSRTATTALSPLCLTATVAHKSQATFSGPAAEKSKLASKESTKSLSKSSQTALSKQTSAKNLPTTASTSASAQHVGRVTDGGSSVSGKHRKMPWTPSETVHVSSQESVTLHSEPSFHKPLNPVTCTASSDSRAATLVSDLSKTNAVYSPTKNTAASPAAPTKLPKTRKNKYTWVANSAKTSLVSKKLSPASKKLNVESEKVKSPAASLVAPKKKSSVTPKSGSVTPKSGSVTNRYKWKAENSGQTSSKKPQEPPIQTTPKGSPYLLAKAQGLPNIPKLSPTDSGLSHYKVRSRTKIIRRRSSSSFLTVPPCKQL